jgi:hypothetical protein
MDLLNKYYSIKTQIEEYIKKKQIINSNKKRLINTGIVFETKFDAKHNVRDLYIYNKSKIVMHIQVSNVDSIFHLLNQFKTTIDSIEKDIVLLKNDILFNYTKMDSDPDYFNELKQKLEYNIEKVNELQTIIIESNLPDFDYNLFYEYIHEYKISVKNENFKEAIQYYIDTIIPFIKKHEYVNNYIIYEDGLIYLKRNQFNYLIQTQQNIKKIVYNEEDIIKMFDTLTNKKKN